MKTIAIDMDEVIVDLWPKLSAFYARLHGQQPSAEDLKAVKEGERPGLEAYKARLSERGFFLDLPAMDGALEALEVLRKRYRIYLVTAAMEFPYSFEDKYAWIEKHLPWLSWKQIVFCGDKSIIRADYMIDDHGKNLVTFSGTPLLYDAFHNRDEARFRRVHNWKEVLGFFDSQPK